MGNIHGVLVVDKPRGPTSHDVVHALRKLLGTRAVGHAGTLDPMASGVLVIGAGEGTKLLHHLSGADKVYVATVKLGAETDTLDAQGRVVAESALPDGLSRRAVEAALAQFRGEFRQKVPVISALKQAGRPLYERARRGEAVEAPERAVVVYRLELLRVERDELELHVRCGKGFYVRALARDLARALGTLGHLSALRRLASGRFSLADALDWSERAGAAQHLLPLAAAMRDCACLNLNAQGVIEVSHGRPLTAAHVTDSTLPPPGTAPVALLDTDGALRALGRAEPDRVVVIRGIVHPTPARGSDPA